MARVDNAVHFTVGNLANAPGKRIGEPGKGGKLANVGEADPRAPNKAGCSGPCVLSRRLDHAPQGLRQRGEQIVALRTVAAFVPTCNGAIDGSAHD